MPKLPKYLQRFKSKSQCSAITFSYKWTIENYSRLYEKGYPWKWRICSNEFAAPNNEELQFELHLYPKGSKITNKDHESLGVRVFDIPQKYEGKIQCRWNVKIEGENEVKCATEKGKIYHLYRREWKVLNCVDDKQLFDFPSELPNDQLTLNFEIHLQAEKSIFNVITKKVVGSSRFDCSNKFTKVAHTWTIDNFNRLFDGNREAPYFIQSDHFPARDDKSERFCLRLCPKGWSERSKDNIELFVWNDNEDRASVHYRAYILGLNGEKYFIQVDTEKIPSKYGRHFGLNRAKLLRNLKALVNEEKLEDNRLQIYFEMTYMMDSAEGKDKLSDQKSGKESDKESPKESDKESNKEFDKESNKEFDKKSDKESNKESDKESDKEFDKESDKKLNTELNTELNLDLNQELNQELNMEFDTISLPVFKSESNYNVASKTILYVKKPFNNLYQNSGKNRSIDSPIFLVPDDHQMKFLLCLWPNGYDEQNNKYLALELHNASHCGITAQYRISILDADGNQWNRWGDQSVIAKDGNVRRSKFFLQSQFHNSSLISHFLPKGKLTIVCEIWIVQDREIYDNVDHAPEQIQGVSGFTAPVNINNVHVNGYFQVNSTSNIRGNVDLKVDTSK